MKHTVLARKWRPKKFADLIGQQNSVKILNNLISNNRIHHAILLTGTRGIGKTTIARIIAKSLNCLNSINSEPCTQCDNCVQIDTGNFIDVIEIDAASNTGVDNIRELIENARYSPTSGKYKIYIIDEVHMLSKSAFNAMLKTLEEPPTYVVFILATTDSQKVPPTILSRCLQLKLRNLLVPEIEKHLATVLLNEQNTFEQSALGLIAVAASGSMRDALSILDQAIAFSNGMITELSVKQMLGITSDELIYSILNALSSLNSELVMQTVKQINESGADLEQVLLSLQQKLCELNISQLTNQNTNTELSYFIDKISVNDVQLYFEIANLGLEQLKIARDKYPVFVMTLLRMIAFNIGTNEQKTITLTNSNFKVTNEFVKSEKLLEFDGNWFTLISILKPQLGSLYSFVENAQLKNYNQSFFEIVIDERYQGAFNQNFIIQLEQILSNYFGRSISTKIIFAKDVNDTLNQKNLQQHARNQADAEQAINNDNYLVNILDEFSAKIVAGSIKPNA